MSRKKRLRSVSRNGHGTGGFIAQRFTAVALLVLGPWFIVSLALASKNGPETARSFFATPLNAAVSGAFVVAACWHMQIGMREIIEDYIARPGTRKTLEFLNMLVALIAALAGLYGLAKISLGV